MADLKPIKDTAQLKLEGWVDIRTLHELIFHELDQPPNRHDGDETSRPFIRRDLDALLSPLQAFLLVHGWARQPSDTIEEVYLFHGRLAKPLAAVVANTPAGEPINVEDVCQALRTYPAPA